MVETTGSLAGESRIAASSEEAKIDELIAAIADKRDEESMSEEETKESEIWTDMIDLWEKLDGAKPTDRSERARHYAVTITEFQKVMGYFFIFVHQECSLEFRREQDSEQAE